MDFERYVGRTFFAGPGNPALLPEVLKCSETDLDPWPKDLYPPPLNKYYGRIIIIIIILIQLEHVFLQYRVMEG